MLKKVIVNDKMQKNYVYYLSEKMGDNFNGEFKPELTPREMLALGVFGGRYMCDCRKEFPANWFQWYCRYCMGRRHEDDSRQIRRWKAFRRHYSAVKNNCFPTDFDCRPKQRQALLHWAYDSKKI